MIKKVINKLPKEYQEVDYVKSTSGYIDLGYKPNTNTRIKLTFSFEQYGWKCLLGAENSANENNCRISITSSEVFHPTNPKIYPNIIYNCGYNDIGIYINDIQFSNKVKDCDYNLYIFALNRSGNTADNNSTVNAKIYKCEIYEKIDEVVYNKFILIPCYRKSDNKVGFFNTVNGEFITNTVGEDFICGADIYPIKKISSIKKVINNELKDIKRVYKGNKLMFSHYH